MKTERVIQILSISILSLILIFTGCKEDDPTVKVINVSLNETSLNMAPSETQNLTATITPADATNKKVSWTSSNSDVATVDGNGKITAIKEGSATINVVTDDGAKTASCSVTVITNKVAVTGVTIDPESISILEGSSEQLTAEVKPENADNKKVSWSSDKTDIATVDNEGNVKGVSVGKAKITVTTEDGEKTATCTVNVTAEIFGSFTDSRDGNIYKSIEIGNQIWMAENLKYLPADADVSGPDRGSKTEPYYYVYDYNGTDKEAAKATENYKTYGVLYNWAAAMAKSESSNSIPSGVQGICPEGWHLPSDAEWTALENYLIANGYNYDGSTEGNKIAIAMAEPGLWRDYQVTGTIGNSANYPEYANKSGFSALPGGYRLVDGVFYGITTSSVWWSSTEDNKDDAYYWLLYHIRSYLSGYNDDNGRGFSVRCVRD